MKWERMRVWYVKSGACDGEETECKNVHFMDVERGSGGGTGDTHISEGFWSNERRTCTENVTYRKCKGEGGYGGRVSVSVWGGKVFYRENRRYEGRETGGEGGQEEK